MIWIRVLFVTARIWLVSDQFVINQRFGSNFHLFYDLSGISCFKVQTSLPSRKKWFFSIFWWPEWKLYLMFVKKELLLSDYTTVLSHNFSLQIHNPFYPHPYASSSNQWRRIDRIKNNPIILHVLGWKKAQESWVSCGYIHDFGRHTKILYLKWVYTTYTAPYESLGCCVNTRCRMERSRGELMQQGRKWHPFKAFRLSYFHPPVATESSRKDKASIGTLSRLSVLFTFLGNFEFGYGLHLWHVRKSHLWIRVCLSLHAAGLSTKYRATTKQRSQMCG